MIPKKGNFSKLWGLEPSTVFLNHGSFGAAPIAVLEEQTRIRNEMEEDPVYFVEKKMNDLWQKSILELSKFLNTASVFLCPVTTPYQSLHFLHG